MDNRQERGLIELAKPDQRIGDSGERCPVTLDQRKRSDVHLAVSPYTNPIQTDDLKRYRDAGGRGDCSVAGPGRNQTGDGRAAGEMAKEFVEPAASG